jgi:organic hydroperoxide reductase OsmC/OhrA
MAFGIEVTLNVYLIGMEQAEAEQLVAAAHIVCPYSNATRGNIDVNFNITTE